MSDEIVIDQQEFQEWCDALSDVTDRQGPSSASSLFSHLGNHAKSLNLDVQLTVNTPYANTIPTEEEKQTLYQEESVLQLQNIGMAVGASNVKNSPIQKVFGKLGSD